MNFDDAIAAHIKWKVRLAQFIDGTSQERLLSATVAQDDLCELGQWLRGEGARYASLPHYRELIEKHAHFHRCAAEVVRKVENRDRAGAKVALGGAFAAASKETVQAIMALKKEAGRR